MSKTNTQKREEIVQNIEALSTAGAINEGTAAVLKKMCVGLFVEGPRGKRGHDGIQGPPGFNGRDGINGVTDSDVIKKMEEHEKIFHNIKEPYRSNPQDRKETE